MPKITKKIDDTQAEKMLLQGVSQSKIAKHFGVSASAVSSWAKSYYAKKRITENARPVNTGKKVGEQETATIWQL